MRTTLTLDDDLAGLLKERARRLGISFKEMVNRAIRTGLGSEVEEAISHNVRTIPHAFGLRPGVDPDKMNQLADELEADAFVESYRRQIE